MFSSDFDIFFVGLVKEAIRGKVPLLAESIGMYL